MSYIHARNALTFDGLLAQYMSFSCTQDTLSVYSFDSENSFFVPGLKHAELDCKIIVFPDDINRFENLTEKLLGVENGLVNLGPGCVCEYCGDYKVAGELKCRRCGGIVREEKFVSVNSFPFLLHGYTMEASYSDLTVCDFQFTSVGPVDNYVLNQLMTGVSLETLPHSFTLDTSKYLCEFCGMIVESGRSCPGCGGIRIPLSEVVRMGRNCVYCGNKVVGGIVCQSCGARLSGLSYRAFRSN